MAFSNLGEGRRAIRHDVCTFSLFSPRRENSFSRFPGEPCSLKVPSGVTTGESYIQNKGKEERGRKGKKMFRTRHPAYMIRPLCTPLLSGIVAWSLAYFYRVRAAFLLFKNLRHSLADRLYSSFITSDISLRCSTNRLLLSFFSFLLLSKLLKKSDHKF